MTSLLERLLGEDSPDEQVDLEDRQHEADEALSDRVDPSAYGIDDCAVTGVAVVNEGPEGEPIVVPIARFALGESVDSPEADRVWDLVGEALSALVPAFEGVFVRHYDVQFTFDGDGLLDAESSRRIAVTPALAERFVTEPGFGVLALREAMVDAHDADDEIAPVAWSACEDYSDRRNAAVVTGGVVAATGASAATCAGAGAAGGGGGAC